MPPREWRLRLEDILECIEEIERFTAGLSFDEFAKDRKTLKAVDYDFVVIGEAANHVPPEIAARYPDVPWANVRGMRNVMAHEYFGIDLLVLWETIQHQLPPLAKRLREILAQESEPE